MDLNVIVYQEKEFASEKAITSKVMRAVNGKCCWVRVLMCIIYHF